MVNDSRLKCKLIKASNQFWKWISIMLKKFHLSLAGIFRPFFVQKNKNIQHINEGRKSPAKQLFAGNNYSLTSCVGSNPRPKYASLSPPASLAALRAGYIYSLYSASRLRLSASARLGNEGVSLSYHEPERRVIIFNLVTSLARQAVLWCRIRQGR